MRSFAFRTKKYGNNQEFYVRGALHSPPMEEHPLENYKKAIENSMDGKHAKQIFIIDDEKSSKI